MADTQNQPENQVQVPLEAPAQITFMNITQKRDDGTELKNIGLMLTMHQKDADGQPVRRAMTFDVSAAKQLVEMMQAKIKEVDA